MWEKIVGYSLLAVIGVAGAGFAYLYFRTPAIAPPSGIKVDMSAQRVARGEYVFGLADCDGCHSPTNEKLYDHPPVEGMRAAGQISRTPNCRAGWLSPTSLRTRRRVSETGRMARRSGPSARGSDATARRYFH